MENTNKIEIIGNVVTNPILDHEIYGEKFYSLNVRTKRLSDVEDKENNSVYQVKAVVKANSQKTFARNNQTSIEDIPLII